MFYQNAYNVQQLGFPANGMNQNISPEVLPNNFAYYLENIISSPRGKGKVRYGTIQIADFPYDNQLYKIIEAFPFQKENGDKQIVSYLQYFVLYQGASYVVCLENNKFSFVAVQGTLFEEDTPIRIQYRTAQGTVFTETFLTSVEANAAGALTITLKTGVLPTRLPPGFFVEVPQDVVTRVDTHTLSFSPKPNRALNQSFDPAFNPGVRIRLSVNGHETLHAIASYDGSQQGVFIIRTALDDLPVINPNDDVHLFYESFVCEIISFYFVRGSVVIYDFATGALLNVTRENMSAGVVPRSVTFQDKLVICNGVDPLLSWDGTTLAEVTDFVKEQANSFNRIGNTSFSFTCNAAFLIEKYQTPHGRPAQIRLRIDGVISNLTVSAIQRAQNTVTITTAEILPAFGGQNRSELFYKDWPPPFSFMYVAYDRIYALAPGAVGLKYRDPDNALRVFYAFRPNSLTDWFDEATKTVPSIDISDKHGVPDNLEAICFVNGRLVFMGRYKTQAWVLDNPATSSIRFSNVLPDGIIHGNLLIELSNDTYFITQGGKLQSVGTLNIAQQFATTSSDTIDPLIREQVVDITRSNILYRACRSFKYSFGPFCGFKIGDNNPLIGLYNTNIYAWSTFSGDFMKSSTFLSTLDGALYLFIEDRVLQYADGVSIPESYGDNDGKDPVYFSWILPVVQSTQRRWANKFYELQVDYASSFVIDNNNKIFIRIRGDLSKTFSLKNMYNLQYRGDVIGSITFSNSNNRNEIGYRPDEPFSYPKGRLKFVSSQFWLSLEGYVLNSSLEFNTIKLFGLSERSGG